MEIFLSLLVISTYTVTMFISSGFNTSIDMAEGFAGEQNIAGISLHLLRCFLIDLLVISCLQFLPEYLSVRQSKAHSVWQLVAEVVFLLWCVGAVFFVHHMPLLLISYVVLLFGKYVYTWCTRWRGRVIESRTTSAPCAFFKHHWSSDYYAREVDSDQFCSTDSAAVPRVVHRKPLERDNSSAILTNGGASVGNNGYCIPTSDRVHKSTSVSKTSVNSNSLVATGKQLADYSAEPLLEVLPALSVNGKSRHPPGLPNHGRNLCFLNTVLQCLARCPGIVDDLQAIIAEKDETNEHSSHLEVLSESIELLSRLTSPTVHKLGPSLLDTKRFRAAVSAIDATMVAPPQDALHKQMQFDAGEFLLWLLNSWDAAAGKKAKRRGGRNLTEAQAASVVRHICSLDTSYTATFVSTLPSLSLASIARVKKSCEAALPQLAGQDPLPLITVLSECRYLLEPKSPVRKRVTTQMESVRSCRHCKFVCSIPDRSAILSAPILQRPLCTTTLHECLDTLSDIEELAKTERLKCSCGRSDGRYKFDVVCHAPSVLIVQLLRSEYAEETKTIVKRTTPVQCPATGLFLTTIHFLSKVENVKTCYDLKAVCIHNGSASPTFGHYIAYAQDKSHEWFKFDDELVTPVTDMRAVLESPLIQSNSYLLFYTLRYPATV